MEPKKSLFLPAPDPNRVERRAHAMIASMAEAGEAPEPDRRDGDRQRFIAQGKMRLVQETDAQTDSPTKEVTLYTRDLTPEGVGFIANAETPPAGQAIVEIPGPAGRPIQAQGQVVRTQPFATGWHEGYVQFSGPIDLFSDQPIRVA